ncbi:histidine--tRNA ligase [soil metagenome]
MAERDEAFRALKGTYDKLPPESRLWRELVESGLGIAARAGYEPVIAPVLEHTEVFARGVGESSDVVTKQMYSFTDRAGRSLTLRPEGTAGIVRAVLEHGLDRGPLPVKLAYAGPFFRQERPQKGRFRELWQFGIEALGSEGPLIDAEAVLVGERFLAEAGVRQTLLLNSIGHLAPGCRDGYLSVLVEWLERRAAELAEEDRQRVSSNPLRTFDSKEPATIAVMSEAPFVTEHLCAECKSHFDAVQQYLMDAGVSFVIEPRLVRGLDYYTRTAWEYVSEDLGAQSSVGGGGRYDGLAAALGGPPLPGIGFGIGLDRVVLARRGEVPGGSVQVYVIALGDDAHAAGWRLVSELRAAGVGADLDHMGRAMKGQMKAAARSGARWAVILGNEELATGEAAVKDLVTGEQERLPLAEAVRRVST